MSGNPRVLGFLRFFGGEAMLREGFSAGRRSIDLRETARWRALRALSLFIAMAAGIVVPTGAPAAQAEQWPSRPVQIVVPFAPGGSNDIIARRLAERLSRTLGQQVVVSNKSGAGGTIGAQVVATSAADGYTFLFVSGSLATSAAVQKTPYDAVAAFDAVSLVATAPFVVLTREGFPAKSIKELVAYAKANPGKINYGSAGLGDSSQMATELFNSIAGTKMVVVGYKGIAPAQFDLVGGRLDLIITTMASIRGSASDKLPKLAFTSAKRDPDHPDVPTVLESSIDYVVDVWWGLFAPAGISPEIRHRMNKEIGSIIAEPEFAEFLKASGARPSPSTPQELQDLLKKDVLRWTDTAKRAGISRQ